MTTSWFDLLAAAMSGGIVVKVLDYLYDEYLRRAKAKKSARELIDRHIDPILKSSDELVGKIRSLAQSDFQALKKIPVPNNGSFEEWVPFLNFIYLFAQFWSRIQILRSEGIFINLGADERGRKLIDFFRALESKRSRIVDRSWQRAMGETLLSRTDNGLINMTYTEFADSFINIEAFRRWYHPLVDVISRIDRTRDRQRLLTYGVIIHSLIDTLDSDHLVTRPKPGWANKLNKKSLRNLKYRIFKIYLPFVKNRDRYLTRAEAKKRSTAIKKRP